MKRNKKTTRRSIAFYLHELGVLYKLLWRFFNSSSFSSSFSSSSLILPSSTKFTLFISKMSNTLYISGFQAADFPPKSPSDYSSGLTNTLFHLISATYAIPVLHWGNLKSFRRVIAVFESAHDAARARLVVCAYAKAHEEAAAVKAWFGDAVSPSNQKEHLRLPDPSATMFVISPPATPPLCENSGLCFGAAAAEADSEFKQKLHAALESCQPSQGLPPASYEAVSPSGKLVRRATLHEACSCGALSSADSAQKPLLSLQTSGMQTSAAVSPLTPTIVLEWDENE